MTTIPLSDKYVAEERAKLSDQQKVEALHYALAGLVYAIGRKWDGETEHRRSNALSPLIEERLQEAKDILALTATSTTKE